MGGGNAFLRFSSSVAAGALILPHVARAQTCVAPESPPGVDGCCAPVNDYEGCGSCEDPTLRLLTTVESSSSTSTSLKYTNCGREPFLGTQFITLEKINSDITTLRGTLADCTTNNTDVSVVSFPCITDGSSIVVEFDEGNVFPSLEKIRFANLVTVDGFTIERMPALTSISAPLLQSASFIQIGINTLLPKIDFPSLSTAGLVDIGLNENLKKISLPQLTTVNIFFEFQNNFKLRKLCASKLENGGDVCIGNNNNQPFLDADLSELVDGSIPTSGSPCYTDSNPAPTVCGAGGTTGLFSTDGCPSNACS